MFYKFFVTERNKVCIALQHIATFYQGLHCYKDKTLFSHKKEISFDYYVIIIPWVVRLYVEIIHEL